MPEFTARADDLADLGRVEAVPAPFPADLAPGAPLPTQVVRRSGGPGVQEFVFPVLLTPEDLDAIRADGGRLLVTMRGPVSRFWVETVAQARTRAES